MTAPRSHGPPTYQVSSSTSSKSDWIADGLPSLLAYLSRSMSGWSDDPLPTKSRRHGRGTRLLGRIFSITNILVLAWLCMIWWGERLVFQSSLNPCHWQQWEQWPPDARPHRVVLIADPQLVDPHTYPGRPWPLSSITIAYSDQYLRRSYRYLQNYLQPNTVFFLGDLFDGGREWGTSHSSSPEDRFRRYGNRYWINEYARFQRIFTEAWLRGNSGSSAEAANRKFIASLPGNHDLGFASGIQVPVKERFEAYFGTGNRIDIIGNHSFVSVDTVSLSAMDQVDSSTGSSGTGDGTSPAAANRAIWGPTEEFLSQARQAKNRAIQRELRALAGLPEQASKDSGLNGYAPNVINLAEVRKTTEPKGAAFANAEKSFPSILLTHVPLYRPPDTDCGALRERGHAIAVQAGYQYQNVLTRLISKDIVTKLGMEEITQVYSGDDHDYCEVSHDEFTGRIKEITVKSISLAMGVRKPGFLAVSLHNPVDLHPTREDSNQENLDPTMVRRDTIQNHLCLLPDQLAILARYAMLLILTLLTLAVKTWLTSHPSNHHAGSGSRNDKPLLPLSKEKSPPPLSDGTLFPHAVTSSTSSSSSSSAPDPTITGGTLPAYRMPPLQSEPPKFRGGYGNLPASSRSASPSKSEKLDTAFAPAAMAHVWSVDCNDWGSPRRTFGHGVREGMKEFSYSLGRVAAPVLVYYVWLVLRG